MSYAQLCQPSSVKERRGGKIIGWPTSAACVCWIYCCAAVVAVVVGLRDPTTDELHVASAVLLACCWRWQHVVAAAFLHLTCLLQLSFKWLSIIFLRRRTILGFWNIDGIFCFDGASMESTSVIFFLTAQSSYDMMYRENSNHSISATAFILPCSQALGKTH